jgi:pantothenate kinase
MEKINEAVEFMSEGKTSARFMTYDGYLGAIGAFLQEFKYYNKEDSIGK